MSTITLPEPALDEPFLTDGPVDDRSAPPPGVLRRLVRGREADAAWVRPSLLALLVGTAVLYLWGLGASGWANTFYSGAVQAGTKSWSAFFFGSSDAAGFITVDKPPAALWVMELSARIFGVNAWSILVPQALEGVAAVAFLYAAVRRWFTPAAGLIAGAVLALTPVAVLMFRFNNPDALLVLLLTAGAWALVRALERGRTSWLVLAFSLVGFAFLAKMLQAFLVVPAFGLVYLVGAPNRLRTRLWQLTLAGVAMIAAAGWWVTIVELIPASSRPYIGGSQHNSVLELIVGYNGFGRLTGSETGSVTGGGGGGNAGQWGATGWTRLFNSQFGGQVAWLIPAALILAVGVLVLTIGAKRTDRTRAAVLLWGGWFLVTAAVFSLGQGIIHPYYGIALAPAIGALVGIGTTVLWRERARWLARGTLAVAVAATGVCTYVLLDRTPRFDSWLRLPVLVAGFVLAGAMLLGPRLRDAAAAVGVTGALFVGLSGSAAYAVDTAAAAQGGAIPSAGPSTGFGPGGGGPGGPGGRGGPGGPAGAGLQGGLGGAARGTGQQPARPGGAAAPGAAGTAGVGGGGPTAGGGGIGGLLNGSTPSAELTTLLKDGATGYTWTAATVGANQAAGYQLASDEPVMAIGGFNGSDPAPSLAGFQELVADGKVHYFIAGGMGGGPNGGNGGSSVSNQISTWVAATYSSSTVGGTTVYDLTKPRTAATTSANG